MVQNSRLALWSYNKERYLCLVLVCSRKNRNAQVMCENDLFDTFPECSKVVHILAVIPATSCSTERSLSPLRWLKTYLCSTMEQQCVSNIAFINSKRAYANSVVNNGSYHWYLRPSEWQRQLYILVYRMTLPLRLFHKNLGNLREFFGQVVHPLAKINN